MYCYIKSLDYIKMSAVTTSRGKNRAFFIVNRRERGVSVSLQCSREGPFACLKQRYDKG